MFLKSLMVAAALGTATPALAQTNANFVGPRVELNAGLADFDNNDVDYGLALGVDGALSDRVTLGAELTGDNLLDGHRTVGGAARLGYAINPTTLAFARVGYEKFEDLDHPTLGAGLNFAIAPNAYANVEYRYKTYEHNNDSHGARVGIGLRF